MRVHPARRRGIGFVLGLLAIVTAVGAPTSSTNAVSAGGGTVVGNLELVTLPMPQYSDGRERTIRIWTPATYEAADTSRRYPVLYMHDGQNLFDAATSFAGEWNVDESITDLMSAGYKGSIVVGVDNSADRLNELSPPWPRLPGAPMPKPSGDKYIDFIVKTVKPYVDSHYNTKPGRASTGIGGSSMGGIISFYAGLRYPRTFGKVLAFSPSFPFYNRTHIMNLLKLRDFRKKDAAPRLYLYSGGAGSGATSENAIARLLPALVKQLRASGYPPQSVTSHVWEVAQHSEGFWTEMFPTAFDWLFLSNADRATMAVTTLAIGYASGDSAGSVTAHLSLDSSWDWGARVSWKSSHPKIISSKGKFTRPQTPQQIRLTATVTVGRSVRTRTFVVQVLAR